MFKYLLSLLMLAGVASANPSIISVDKPGPYGYDVTITESNSPVSATGYWIGAAYPNASMHFELGADFVGTLYACDSTTYAADTCDTITALSADLTGVDAGTTRRAYVLVVSTDESASTESILRIVGSFEQGGGGGPWREFSVSGAPVGLWTFEQNGTDQGSAGKDLSWTAGTELYTIVNGLWAADCSAVTTPAHWLVNGAAAGSSLEITGALTIHVLYQVEVEPSARMQLIGFDEGTGDVNGTENYIYSMTLESNQSFRYFAETGAAGTNIAYNPTGAGTNKVPINVPTLWTLTRDAGGDVIFYMDGQLVATSGDLAVPSCEATCTSTLNVCSSGEAPLGANFFDGYIFGIKIYDRQLSASEVESEWKYISGSK